MAKPSQPQQPGVSAQRATPPVFPTRWTIPTGSQPRKAKGRRTRPQSECCDPCGIGWKLCFSGGVTRSSVTPGCCGWDGFAILAAPNHYLRRDKRSVQDRSNASPLVVSSPMAYLGSAMRRIHDLSRISQFLLFFLAPTCFSLGAFQMIPPGGHPTHVGEAMLFLSLYFIFSISTEGYASSHPFMSAGRSVLTCGRWGPGEAASTCPLSPRKYSSKPSLLLF